MILQFELCPSNTCRGRDHVSGGVTEPPAANSLTAQASQCLNETRHKQLFSSPEAAAQAVSAKPIPSLQG
jgi:hypothetical protein